LTVLLDESNRMKKKVRYFYTTKRKVRPVRQTKYDGVSNAPEKTNKGR
jgi:hypothetical protein